MDMKKHKASYIIGIILFILLYAIIIVGGIWASQRDAKREAKWGYELNIIQSIIENIEVCQDEIESWGYQVSVLTPEEKPEDEALQHYYRNYYQPVLVLTDADGGKYCFRCHASHMHSRRKILFFAVTLTNRPAYAQSAEK